MQPIIKVANVTKTAALFIPVKLGNWAHKKSMFYIANQESEFTERVKAAQAAGTDMATESVQNFVKDQWRLLPYRVVKCREEWDFFKTEGYKNYFNPGKWDLKSLVVEFRFFVHMLAVYLFAVMLGRNSIFPLLEPGSPFVDGLKYVNPNTNR
jgi:hypothetical protein